MGQKKMKKKNKISIIIPCYNERNNIQTCLCNCMFELEAKKFEYEIVVVDDGSSDCTKMAVLDLMKKFKRIKLISYLENEGKGFAVRQGLIKAKYKTKLILDCDLSVDITELSTLNFDWVKKQKIIKGHRLQIIPQPLFRILVGKIWKVITWFFTGLYMDTQCPFMILNTNQSFYKNTKINGFAFDVEYLVKAKKEGHKINIMKVDYINQIDSRVTFVKTLKMILEIWKIKKNNRVS